MGLKSYLTSSLSIAIEISKAPIIKRKLITKYHKLLKHSYTSEDKNNISKFHLQNNLKEEPSIQSSDTSKALVQRENKIKAEVIEKPMAISDEDLISEDQKETKILPPESIITKIIIRKGIITEQVYQTPIGSTISVLF